MLNKHPKAPPPTLPPGPPPSPTLLLESIILRSVKSFPHASAAGPSSLRSSHLREAILCPTPDRAGQILTSLSWFVNPLASGRAPHICSPPPLWDHPACLPEEKWRPPSHRRWGSASPAHL